MKRVTTFPENDVAEKKLYFSNCIRPIVPSHNRGVYISRNIERSSWHLETDTHMTAPGKIVMFDLKGELITVQKLIVPKGKNSVGISGLKFSKKHIYVVAVYLNSRLVYMHRFNN